MAKPSATQQAKFDLETFSTAPATIPRGIRMHDLSLDSMHWKVTSGIGHVKRGSRSRKVFQYTGTGSTAEGELATLNFPVQPGKTYVFSAWVDPSHITAGKFDLIIDTPDGKSTYAFIFHGSAKAQRFATAAWTCPQGVSSVLLGMQIVDTTVARGKTLEFALPALSDVSLAKRPKNT